MLTTKCLFVDHESLRKTIVAKFPIFVLPSKPVPVSYTNHSKIYNLHCSWNAFFVHRKSGFSANDGRWHHICVTWRNSDGAWKFYKDGVLHHHSINFKRGYTIKAGGSLVLGQEQDGLGTGFDSSQSFLGFLTNVNVWSYVMSPNVIRAYSKSCRYGAGNVYKWSDFIYGIRGKPAIVIPSPC